MTSDRRVAFVVPGDIASPARPTGGNVYDSRLVAGLRDEGWAVDVRPIAGPWTDSLVRSAFEPDVVARALADLPDGSVVLVDGLLAVPAAGVLAAHAARVRLVPLMHMSMAVAPPGHDRPGAVAAERSVLGAAAAIIATSEWLREQLVTFHGVDPERVAAAPPGVDPAPVAVPSSSGERLLCVAAVAPHKGHDVLVGALARLSGLGWTCRCAGPLDRDVDFATTVHAAAAAHGIGDRLMFTGVRNRRELAADYAASDLLVLPTRSESYGMVLTEALARGLPVIVSDVGGVVEAATGASPSAGTSAGFPGALVPPGNPEALADTLQRWLTVAGTRAEWRQRARQRRLRLPDWRATARRAASVIQRASAAGIH